MIPANPGLVARYEYEDAEGNISPTYRRVEAWDRYRKALVARSDGHLVQADSFPNFVAIAEESQSDPHIGFIAGQGWRLRYEHPGTGQVEFEPVVGFAFTADGIGVPLEELSGLISPAEGGTYRLIPPDAAEDR